MVFVVDAGNAAAGTLLDVLLEELVICFLFCHGLLIVAELPQVDFVVDHAVDDIFVEGNEEENRAGMNAVFTERPCRIDDRPVEDANKSCVLLFSRNEFDFPNVRVNVLTPNICVEGNVDDSVRRTENANDVTPLNRTGDCRFGTFRAI